MRACGSPPVASERPVYLGERDCPRQAGEGPPLGDLLRRAEEPSPRRAGQRPADADPPDSRLGQLRDRGEVAANQHVDRPGRDGLYHGDDVAPGPDAGSVEAIGAGFGVCGEPPDRFGEVGAPDGASLRAAARCAAAGPAGGMARMWPRASSSETWLSCRPSDQANPELVVASALKPSWTRSRALPWSHGLGITKQPD